MSNFVKPSLFKNFFREEIKAAPCIRAKLVLTLFCDHAARAALCDERVRKPLCPQGLRIQIESNGAVPKTR